MIKTVIKDDKKISVYIKNSTGHVKNIIVSIERDNDKNEESYIALQANKAVFTAVRKNNVTVKKGTMKYEKFMELFGNLERVIHNDNDEVLASIAEKVINEIMQSCSK